MKFTKSVSQISNCFLETLKSLVFIVTASKMKLDDLHSSIQNPCTCPIVPQVEDFFVHTSAETCLS